jgi:hypothetical protein
MTTLDIDAVEAFVLVAEMRSFTRAGAPWAPSMRPCAGSSSASAITSSAPSCR